MIGSHCLPLDDAYQVKLSDIKENSQIIEYLSHRIAQEEELQILTFKMDLFKLKTITLSIKR